MLVQPDSEVSFDDRSPFSYFFMRNLGLDALVLIRIRPRRSGPASTLFLKKVTPVQGEGDISFNRPATLPIFGYGFSGVRRCQ